MAQPLVKQLVELPFAASMDTGTDPKQTQGHLLLKNMEIVKQGRLDKRKGLLSLNAFGVDYGYSAGAPAERRDPAGTIASFNSVYDMGGQPCINARDRYLRTVNGITNTPDGRCGRALWCRASNSSTSWTPMAEGALTNWRKKFVGKPMIEQPSNVNVAVYGNYACIVYGCHGASVLSYGLYYDHIDTTTGRIIDSGSLTAVAADQNAVVHVIGGIGGSTEMRFLIMWRAITTGYITGRILTPGARATTASFTVNAAFTPAVDNRWDSCVHRIDVVGKVAIVATRATAGGAGVVAGNVALLKVDYQGNVTAYDSGQAALAASRMCVFPLLGSSYLTDKLCVARCDGVNTYVDTFTKDCAYDQLCTLAGSVVANLHGGGGYLGTIGCTTVAGTTTYLIVITYTAATGVFPTYLQTLEYSPGVSVAASTQNTLPSLWNVADLFVYSNKLYGVFYHFGTAGEEQEALCLVRFSAESAAGAVAAHLVPHIVAVIQGTDYQYMRDGVTATGWYESNKKLQFPSLNDTNLCLPVPMCEAIAADGAAFQSGYYLLHMDNVSGVTDDFIHGADSAKLADDLLVVGGAQIMVVDSSKAQEAAFVQPPRITTAASGGIVGGGLVAGQTYSYVAVYEWVDRKGRRWQSPASVPINYTVGGGAGDVTALLTVTVTKAPSFLNDGVTAPDYSDKFHNIKVVLYRTQQGPGTIYTRLSTTPMPCALATTTVGIYDAATDASIAGNSLLYLSADEVERTVPPGGEILCAGKDRVFHIPFSDRTAVWYTKPAVGGAGLEWCGEFVARVDEGGDITGLAVLDSNVIVFKSDSIYAFSGDGPNAVGQGGFSQPQLLARGVGCINHQSIVVFQEGVAFQGRKGLHMISRGLQVQYIGAPVEDYVVGSTLRCVGAVDIASKKQLMFVIADVGTAGTTSLLRFDYQNGIWSADSAPQYARGAVMSGNKLWVVFSALGLYYEDATALQDGVAGALTSYACEVTTPWIKPAGLVTGFQRLWELNIEGTFPATGNVVVKLRYDYDNTDVQTVTVDCATLGNLNQIRIKPTRQKCKAVCANISYTGALDFKLSKLGLVIGSKGDKMNRLAKANSF